MKMVLFLQNEANFDNFYKYGCYCFPDGEENVIGGYGDPQDNVDMVFLTLKFKSHLIIKIPNCKKLRKNYDRIAQLLDGIF